MASTERGDGERPEEIQEEIEQTRAEMSETIDEISERLSPRRLKQDAIGAIRERTVGKAQQVATVGQERAQQAGARLIETTRQVTSQAQQQARQVKGRAQQARQQHPRMLLAFMCLGAVVGMLASLLIVRARRRNAGEEPAADLVAYIDVHRDRSGRPDARDTRIFLLPSPLSRRRA